VIVNRFFYRVDDEFTGCRDPSTTPHSAYHPETVPHDNSYNRNKCLQQQLCGTDAQVIGIDFDLSNGELWIRIS